MGCRTLVCIVLLTVLLPTTHLAAFRSPENRLDEGRSAGIVHSIGNVRIDGMVADESSVFFDHAILETGRGSARVSRKGSIIFLNPNSQLVLAGNTLWLGCGSATLKTIQGMSVLGERYRITPNGLNAQYRLQQSIDHLKVSFLEGESTVLLDNQKVRVSAGHSLEIPGRCIDGDALKRSLSGSMLASSQPNPTANRPATPSKISATTIIDTSNSAVGQSSDDFVAAKRRPISPSAP